MQFEDVRKLATGTVLFNLNRIIAPRLITILYLLGLAGIVLWAIDHFFDAFRFGFGNGLWGLLEIAVFGLLALVILRIVCEAVIVFFRAHEAEAVSATRPRAATSLIDDVRGAIEELAEEEQEASTVAEPASRTPAATASAAAPAPAKKTPAKRAASTTGAKKAATPKKRGTAASTSPASTRKTQ
ncbi:DUF4282 domain-containing protein [Pelagibacterium xiamenense]|uniref:DUF4282 domain-containing protein n=1 Tax=Pelagibacterium xiamenense TaxID=2901140 RepID=UPI001E38C2EA|nr:DUF4282 domain-containing protein [Pelagibacterium xiamenense]MCD7061193.1 DUF4282 domain-containing protein [Pelagibacterium xiamenense]